MIFMSPLIKYNLRFERRTAKVRTRSAVGELKKSSPTATLDSNVLVNTFTNKEIQTDAVYANGFTYLANLQRFKMRKRLDHDLYEVELYKKRDTSSIFLCA